MSNTAAIPRSRLLERTIELLKARPKQLRLCDIERDTGLPMGWLDSLYRKDMSPSVDRIVILYEYLSKHTLEVL